MARIPFMRGDIVDLQLPANEAIELQASTVRCVILQGDTGREGQVFFAEIFVVQAREDNKPHKIVTDDVLSGVTRERLSHRVT